MKQEIEEDENELYFDEEIELPLLNYVFNLVFTDEDGTIYKGILERLTRAVHQTYRTF